MNFSTIASVLLVIFSVIAASLAAVRPLEQVAEPSELRGKREHGHGVTGPVHTFVKTDPHAHFKWGVRHHVGHHYAGRR